MPASPTRRATARERTLLATILARATAEDAADLPWLVRQIQRPSFDRVGVLDLETFFPAKERQELALRFNSVLAAPGFDVWLEGVPLDPGAMLYGSDGKPRVAIVSIAHLGDAERMLVVSLLFNALVEWTRRQRGTTSLRALIYMDEVFGYLPPVANPPSKAPLLTLLKQARAYGVGIMLATQNPVDLDYKALSNTGTWFLGKLQTERDKARVLDGLDGVAGGFDRATLDSTLSALGSRVFLMHNVHEHEPVVFETRWTLSYLRGPLGRDELRKLTKMQPTPSAQLSAPKTNSQAPAPDPEVSPSLARSPKSAAGAGTSRPIVPSGIQEVFVPATGATEHSAALYGSAKVQYTDAKRGIDVVQEVNAIAPFTTGAVPIDWENARDAPVGPQDLATSPPPDATFSAPPGVALDAKRYAGWSRDFVDWVVRSRPLTIYSARALKLTSTAGESERDFRDARADGATRSPRCRGREAASELRNEGRARHREGPQGRRSHLPRAAAGDAAASPDRSVGWRHHPWRVPRSQGDVGLDARPGDDRCARCRPVDEGNRGRRVCAGTAHARSAGTGGATAADRSGGGCHRGNDRSRDRDAWN